MLKTYREEISKAKLALRSRNHEVCFVHLERANVLAQQVTGSHIYVHWLMLVAGLSHRDCREVFGQVPRILAAALFSHLWIPLGNSGRARVSALKPVAVPEDLQHFFPSSNA